MKQETCTDNKRDVKKAFEKLSLSYKKILCPPDAFFLSV